MAAHGSTGKRWLAAGWNQRELAVGKMTGASRRALAEVQMATRSGDRLKLRAMEEERMSMKKFIVARR